MSGDEFDNLPDDFADISGVDWARILAGPSSTSAEDRILDLPRTDESLPISTLPSSSTTTTTTTTSMDDFEDIYDNFDPSLLAELDRIEGELATGKAYWIFTSSDLLIFCLFTAVTPQPPSESTSDVQPSHYFSGVFFIYICIIWHFWVVLMLRSFGAALNSSYYQCLLIMFYC